MRVSVRGRTYIKIILTLVVLGMSAFADAEQNAKVNYVPNFSCTGGSYHLRLPKAYAELRNLGKFKSEKITSTYDWGNYKTHDKELLFDGLRLNIVTFTNNPNDYIIDGAEITARHWSLVGEFRVGDLIDRIAKELNVQIAPDAKSLEIGGDTDALTLELSHGRITVIKYGCYTG